MVFINFKQQHAESRRRERTELPFLIERAQNEMEQLRVFSLLFFHITLTKMAKPGRGESKWEIAHAGEGVGTVWQQAAKGQIRETEEKKEKSAQFVPDCKLGAERRNKIRHLVRAHVKPCKWTSPQRRGLPLWAMMDLIASISVKIQHSSRFYCPALWSCPSHEGFSRGRPLLKWHLRKMR